MEAESERLFVEAISDDVLSMPLRKFVHAMK